MNAKDSTLGGYFAEHHRPPAFRGRDGAAYSVDVVVDETDGAPEGAFGATLFFLRWEAQKAVGHLETGFVAYGDSEASARRAAESLTLHEVKAWLDRLVAGRAEREGHGEHG